MSAHHATYEGQRKGIAPFNREKRAGGLGGTFAISSPTFLGERPRGPILGAREDDAPTSPPVALR